MYTHMYIHKHIYVYIHIFIFMYITCNVTSKHCAWYTARLTRHVSCQSSMTTCANTHVDVYKYLCICK